MTSCDLQERGCRLAGAGQVRDVGQRGSQLQDHVRRQHHRCHVSLQSGCHVSLQSGCHVSRVTRCHVSCVTMLVTRHVLHPITRPLLCYCPHVLPPPPQHKPPPILEFLNCDINTFRKPLDKALHWHDWFFMVGKPFRKYRCQKELRTCTLHLFTLCFPAPCHGDSGHM